jgi:putative MATE family efflux protein
VKDLTTGSIPRHMLQLAVPMAAGMLLQTLYLFIDLYFVARLGDAAIAGVAMGGNLMFASFALTQMLAAGTAAMVSQAVGRKDQAEANHVFNQAVGLAGLCTLLTVVGGFLFIGPYVRFFGADEATSEACATFLLWVMPSLALQYAMVVTGAGLRATGIVKPTMVVQMITILLNTLLAPILITGWGTGIALGVAGAGLATTIATIVGVLLMVGYYVKLERYLTFDFAHFHPKPATWAKLLNIGLPAGGEFALMSLTAGTMYWAARGFGTEAQAGIGIGFRVNQMLFIPVVAVAMSATAVAGQNFGARNAERVRGTVRAALTMSAVLMTAVTLFAITGAPWIARIFSSEPEVIRQTVEFMRVLGWNFVPSALAFTCSALFQGLGNTWPPLYSTAIRVFLFMTVGIWMAHQPWFHLNYLFAVSVATVMLQALMTYAWLRQEVARKVPVT